MSEWTIPEPDPGDGDDVTVALETARAELARGFEQGAAEWLERAVTAAAEQGRSERSAHLEATLKLFHGGGPDTARGGSDLSDIDEFSDETIVDQIPRLPSQPPRPRPQPVGSKAASPPPITRIATSPTPVAGPPRPSKGTPIYGAVRVSVRRALGGKWEVRSLGERESVPQGEEEALLVPLRPGAKFV